MISKFLTCTVGKTELQLTETGMTVEQVTFEDQESYFVHVKSEVCVSHITEDVKQMCPYVSLESGADIQAGDTF